MDSCDLTLEEIKSHKISNFILYSVEAGIASSPMQRLVKPICPWAAPGSNSGGSAFLFVFCISYVKRLLVSLDSNIKYRQVVRALTGFLQARHLRSLRGWVLNLQKLHVSDHLIWQTDLRSGHQIVLSVFFHKIPHWDVYLPEQHFWVREMLAWPACPKEHQQAARSNESNSV